MKTSISPTTTRNWNVDVLLHSLLKRREGNNRRHFHQLFRHLRLRNQGTRGDVVDDELGHFDNLLGNRAIQESTGVQHVFLEVQELRQVVHHMRHRKIKDLHDRAEGAEIFQDVPHHFVLPASDLRQRCWQAPAGLFFETEELRLGRRGLLSP